jgi:hypothetical protein
MPDETCYVTIDSGSSPAPSSDSTARQSSPASP